MTKIATIALAALLGAALVGGLFWWQVEGGSAPVQHAGQTVAASAPADRTPAPASSAPAILHPVPEVTAPDAAVTKRFDEALINLFWHPAMASLLRTDNFAYRILNDEPVFESALPGWVAVKVGPERPSSAPSLWRIKLRSAWPWTASWRR